MKRYTVKEVIEQLQGCDQDAIFEVSINQYNKVYTVAYVSPVESRHGGFTLMKPSGSVRLEVWLPENENTYMGVVVRKKS